jgi:uncharacterized protein YbaP (TraB family)
LAARIESVTPLRYRKQILAGIVLLLCWATAQAAPPLYSHGLLWKIERGRQAPSYVFGTIHSEDARVLALPQPVQTAFDGAKTYVMEALLDQDAVLAMTSSMLFNDGRSLKQVLSPGTYEKTIAATTAFGLPELAAQAMQPWALAVALGVPKPKTGVVLDLLLLQQAQQQGKQTAGLESIDEQVSIFYKLPMREQVLMLEDVLKQADDLPRIFASLHEDYLARDLAALERLSNAQQALGNPALAEKLNRQLLHQRNPRMVARMQPYLKMGQAFIAIGALHLPGETGVLNLLAKQGYRVSVVY